MKILEVDSFQDGAQRNMAMLHRQQKEIESILTSVKGLVALEEVLKGEGGNAIRSFYAECHLPLLQYLLLFQERFKQVLSSMQEALYSFEPVQSGYIAESFLEGEVEQGLQQIAQITESLTNEANRIMAQVSDIVHLPNLIDVEVQEGVRKSKMRRDKTVSRLHEFDRSQTNALSPIEESLHIIDAWISDIESLFQAGLTDIDFQAGRWAIQSFPNRMKMAIEVQQTTVGNLNKVSDLNIRPEMILNAFLATRSPIRFGLQGIVKQPTDFFGMHILAFSTLPSKSRSEQEVNESGKKMTEDEQLEALYAVLAEQYNDDWRSNRTPIDPETGDYLITFEQKRQVLGGLGTGTPDGLAPFAMYTFDFFADDIVTMVHPDSTVDERALAAGFTFFKPFKVVDTGQDILKAGIKTTGKGRVSPNAIRKVDNDILDKMEASGGHTLEKHVGKSNEELIKRGIKEKVEAATSFTDKSTATKAIQENLRKNADDIAEWLNESDTGRKVFDASHKYPIGKGALEDKKQVIYDLTNSRLVLVRDPSNELGFKILTSFPVVK